MVYLGHQVRRTLGWAQARSQILRSLSCWTSSYSHRPIWVRLNNGLMHRTASPTALLHEIFTLGYRIGEP